LIEPYRDLFDTNFRKEFLSVNRWFNTVVNQKETQGVVGKVEFAKQEKKRLNETKNLKVELKKQQKQQPQRPKSLVALKNCQLPRNLIFKSQICNNMIQMSKTVKT